MATRFVAGALAIRAELDSRLHDSAWRPTLLLITGSTEAVDHLRALFQIGGQLEGQSVSGVVAIDEMIMCVRASMEEDADRRNFFKLLMGLAF